MMDSPQKKRNRKRMVRSLWFFGGLAAFALQSAAASPEQERAYLLQLWRQIEAMHPTILAAQKEQSPDARVQFHYTAYRDASGQQHNGLWEDLQMIQSGIEGKLNPAPIEPRAVPPVSGDYESPNEK